MFEGAGVRAPHNMCVLRSVVLSIQQCPRSEKKLFESSIVVHTKDFDHDKQKHADGKSLPTPPVSLAP